VNEAELEAALDGIYILGRRNPTPMAVNRRSFSYGLRIPLMGMLILAGCASPSRQSAQAPPSDYARYLAIALSHAKSSGPARIRCVLNPKAAPAFQARHEIELMERDGVLIVLPAEIGQEYAAWFGQRGVRIAWGQTKSLLPLPPIDPSRGGAETGQAAELTALRLLLAAAAPGKLSAVIAGRTDASLTANEERELFSFLFPDSPIASSRAASTRLTLSKDGLRTRLDWSDSGGSLFRIEYEPANTDDLRRKLDEFRWMDHLPPPRPRPRMRDLLAFLREKGMDVPPDTPVAVFTPRGAFAEGDPHLEGAPLSGEMVSILQGAGRVALSIGGAGGLGIPGMKPVEVSSPRIAYFRFYSHGPGAPDGALIASAGQDWMLSFTQSDGDAEIERKISALLMDFLKKR